MHIGIVFLRTRIALDPAEVHRAAGTTWTHNLGLGLASGLLNPKNALFYVSLASEVSAASPAVLVLYGGWMFTLVLVWDLFVAMALGSRRALARLSRLLPWLMRSAGGFLVLFGIALLVSLLVEVVRLAG